MGWDLIYRDRDDMIAMTGEIAEGGVSGLRLFGDATRSLSFLEVQRR